MEASRKEDSRRKQCRMDRISRCYSEKVFNRKVEDANEKKSRLYKKKTLPVKYRGEKTLTLGRNKIKIPPQKKTTIVLYLACPLTT